MKETRKEFSVQAQKESDEISYKKKLERHRVLQFYRICVVMILIAVAAVCVYYYSKNKEYTDYEVRQQYEWNKSQETRCLNLDGYLFTYSKDGMNCTDTKGNKVWSQTYEMQSPMIDTCQDVVAAADYNGRNIYVANTEGIMGTINTTMPIRDFSVAANGVVAAVLADSDVTSIYLYDVKGTVLVYFKTAMSKSGYPMEVSISEDGKLVAVSYLKAVDGEISTDVAFYNFSSVGQNYIDNLVGAYVCNQAVVPLIEFMDEDVVFAISDECLMFYEGSQIPINTAEVQLTEEVLSVYYNEKYVGLVYYNTKEDSTDTYRLVIYNKAGEIETELTFDLEYNEIQLDTKSIIINNEDECSIYNWEGKLKYNGVFKERIECILPMGNMQRYTLVTRDSIQLIELN